MMENCPKCGEQITRVEITTSAGVRAFSLCCDIPLEILDNWDVFEGLPENLQQAAIDRIKAEYAKMQKEDERSAAAFKAYSEKWHNRNDLFYTERAKRWQ